MTCDQLRTQKDEQIQAVNTAQSQVNDQTTIVAADYNVCVQVDGFPNGPLAKPISSSSIQARITFLQQWGMQNNVNVSTAVSEYQTLLNDFNELTDLNSQLESYQCALSATVQQMYQQGC